MRLGRRWRSRYRALASRLGARHVDDGSLAPGAIRDEDFAIQARASLLAWLGGGFVPGIVAAAMKAAADRAIVVGSGAVSASWPGLVRDAARDEAALTALRGLRPTGAPQIAASA